MLPVNYYKINSSVGWLVHCPCHMFLKMISKPAQEVLISHIQVQHTKFIMATWPMQWKRNQHMAGWMLDQKLVTFLVFEMLVRLNSVLNVICKLMS